MVKVTFDKKTCLDGKKLFGFQRTRSSSPPSLRFSPLRFVLLTTVVFYALLLPVAVALTKPQMTLYCNLAVTSNLSATVSECYLRLNKEQAGTLCLNVQPGENDPLAHTCIFLNDLEALLQKFSSALFSTGVESIFNCKPTDCGECEPSDCGEQSDCKICEPSDCKICEDCPDPAPTPRASTTTAAPPTTASPSRPTPAARSATTTTASTACPTPPACVCKCDSPVVPLAVQDNQCQVSNVDTLFGLVQCENLKATVYAFLPFFLHWLNCSLTTFCVYCCSCKGRCRKPNYVVLSTLGFWGLILHRLWVFNAERRIRRDAVEAAQRMQALNTIHRDDRDEEGLGGERLELDHLGNGARRDAGVFEEVPLF